MPLSFRVSASWVSNLCKLCRPWRHRHSASCSLLLCWLAEAVSFNAGVSQIDRVVEAVEETLKGNTVQLLAKKALPTLDLPKVSLPVCVLLGFCSHALRAW